MSKSTKWSDKRYIQTPDAKTKNGRGRLKVEALKNGGAKGTTNPWPRCSR